MASWFVWLLLTCGADADGGEVNLALAREGGIPWAEASAETFAATAAKACDGKATTSWVTATAAGQVEFHIEWPHPVQISALRILQADPATLPAGTPETDAITSYRWHVRTAGGWELAANEEAVGTPWSAPLQCTLTTGREGVSEVRLTVGSHAGLALAIAEIEVMGVMTPRPQDWLPKWQGAWIWTNGSLAIPHREPNTRYFRRRFTVDDPASVRQAWLSAAAFDRLAGVWLNGKLLLEDIAYGPGALTQAKAVEVSPTLLRAGENVLTARVDDIYECGSHCLLAELAIVHDDGRGELIATDREWVANQDRGVEPTWKLPGASENGWLPCVIQSSPNQRWHTLWRVRKPTVGALDEAQVEMMSATVEKTPTGRELKLGIALTTPRRLGRDYAAVLDVGQPSYWVNHDYDVTGAVHLPEVLSTSAWEPGRHDVVFRVPLPEWAPSPLPLTFTLSAPDGAVRITADAPSLRADAYGLHTEVVWKRQSGAPGPMDFPNCDVRTVSGNPRLMIDGKSICPLIWSSAYGTYRRYHDYSKTGITLFRPIIEDTPIPPAAEADAYYSWWLGEVDRLLEAALAVNPEIRLLPAVNMDPSPEWLFGHPSEQMLGNRGTLVIPLAVHVPDRGQVRPTFMSSRWRHDGATALKRLVAHMRTKAYASHLVGLVMFAGRAGENYWGISARNLFKNSDGAYDAVPQSQWQCGDFSVAARRTFRDYLMRKYKTETALRRAWRRESVSFDDIIDPAAFDREVVGAVLSGANRPDSAGSVRDTTSEPWGMMPVDYYQCMAESMVNTFNAWGRAIKQASDGRLLAGCYYGYALSQMYTHVPGFHAHTATKLAMEADSLDVFVSPAEYNQNRRAGGSYWGHNIVDSLRLHNKLWLFEADTRTFLAEAMPKTFSRQETLSVMKRDAAAALVRGSGWWWYEFAKNQTGAIAREWFRDPEIADLGRRLLDLYRTSLADDGLGPSAEIAVFYHGETLTAQDIFAPTAQVNIPIAHHTLVGNMQRIGTGFDLYNLADIPVLERRGLLKQYRLCVFLNPFFVTAEERRWLDLCKGDGRTLLWLYAPGLAGPDRAPTPANIAETIGMPGVKQLNRAARQVYRFTDNSHTLLSGLDRTATHAVDAYPEGDYWERYGNDVWPVFYVDPSAADTISLANWVIDGAARPDMSSLCLRENIRGKRGRWNSVYAAIPELSAEMLRRIARAAGVHIHWSGNEVIFVNRHYLCLLTGAQAASGSLVLPSPMTVTDVFSGVRTGGPSGLLQITIPPFTTRLYRLD